MASTGDTPPPSASKPKKAATAASVDTGPKLSADFKLLVKTSTPIHLIKRQLVERHGRMSELHLYKGGVSSDTELVNDAMTLADYGIIGKRKTDTPDTITVFYNFIPHAHSDALLLATHTRDRVGVS